MEQAPNHPSGRYNGWANRATWQAVTEATNDGPFLARCAMVFRYADALTFRGLLARVGWPFDTPPEDVDAEEVLAALRHAVASAPPRVKRYSIWRFYRDGTPPMLVKIGLTRDEAVAHCSREDTRDDDWFDGFEEE